MLYKIRRNPVHPLNGALPGPYVPVRVTLGAVVAHPYTYAPPRCRTLQYSRTFIPFSLSLWNYLANPVFDGVELAAFKSRANVCFWPKLLYPYYSLLLLTSYQSEDPASQSQPIEWEEKEKIVGIVGRQIIRHWPCFLYPPFPHHLIQGQQDRSTEIMIVE